MSGRLPEFIEPLLFAEKGRQINGEIPLSSLPRLSAMLADLQGTATFSLSFGMNGKIAELRGKVNTVLHLECRNCLEKLAWPVTSEFILGIVSTFDEMALLPEQYEPLLVQESRVRLLDIVEDELLLSVPAFPRHDSDCIQLTQQPTNPPQKADEQKPNNPFSILAKLKTNGD